MGVRNLAKCSSYEGFSLVHSRRLSHVRESASGWE